MKRYIKSAIGNLQKEDELTRFEVAKSPNTDIKTLKVLAKDDSPLVRLGVYNNPNTTSEIRMMLYRPDFSIYHADYQVYCHGDIADKEKISDIVEQAIEDAAICTSTPYVCVPTISVGSDVLGIAGSFDVADGEDYEYCTLDNIRDRLNATDYKVITAYLR